MGECACGGGGGGHSLVHCGFAIPVIKNFLFIN